MDRKATCQRPAVSAPECFQFVWATKSFPLFHRDDARYHNIGDFGWFQGLMEKDMSQKACNSKGFDDWFHGVIVPLYVEKIYPMSPWDLVGKTAQFPHINADCIQPYNMMSHVLYIYGHGSGSPGLTSTQY